MASTIYPQHTEGGIVESRRKAQLSALAVPVAVSPALLSMLGQPNFEITRLIVSKQEGNGPLDQRAIGI